MYISMLPSMHVCEVRGWRWFLQVLVNLLTKAQTLCISDRAVSERDSELHTSQTAPPMLTHDLLQCSSCFGGQTRPLLFGEVGPTIC